MPSSVVLRRHSIKCGQARVGMLESLLGRVLMFFVEGNRMVGLVIYPIVILYIFISWTYQFGCQMVAVAGCRVSLQHPWKLFLGHPDRKVLVYYFYILI